MLAQGPGCTDNSLFQIVGNELETVWNLGEGNTYSIRVQSTNAIGDSIQEEFTIVAIGGGQVDSFPSGQATTAPNMWRG